MKKIIFFASLILILSAIKPDLYGVSFDTNKLSKDLRKLWSDHVFWTRLYIISAISNSPDKQATTNRLLQNQKDLGNAIVPFYGEKAGKDLEKLLRDHILIAGDLIEAAKSNNQKKVKEEDALWHDNAKDIAKFLSAANPNWNENEMLDMLNEHLSLTTQEVTQHLKKQWNDEIKTFDKIYDQALSMADSLYQGLISQNQGPNLVSLQNQGRSAEKKQRPAKKKAY